MKILVSILSLCLVNVAIAKEPDALTKLRKAWQNSVAGVEKRVDALYRADMNNANKLYHKELEQMKDNFMNAKNLQGANDVDAEIKRLIELHGKPKFIPRKGAGKATPLDGLWYTYSKKIPDKKYWRFFQGNLMASDSMSGGFRTSGVSIKAGEVIIDHGAGSLEKLEIDPNNPDLMTGTKVIFERIKM